MNQAFEKKLCDTARREPGLVWLNIQEVADYYYGSEQEYWELGSDFPNVAPPWPRYAVHYRRPGRWRSQGKWVAQPEVAGDVLIVARNYKLEDFYCDPSAFAPAKWVATFELWFSAQSFALYGRGLLPVQHDGSVIGYPLSDTLAETIQRSLGADRWNAQRRARFGFTEGVDVKQWYWSFVPMGCLPDMRQLSMPQVLATIQHNKMTSEQWEDQLAHQCQVVMHPLLLAISFAHCKNVEVGLQNGGANALNRAQRRRLERQGEPGIKWHVLNITPMRRIVDAARAGVGGSIQRALGICRGHFKDYRERGLFGREDLKGRYWWQDHLRGNAAAGEIEKEYRIEAPQ